MRDSCYFSYYTARNTTVYCHRLLVFHVSHTPDLRVQRGGGPLLMSYARGSTTVYPVPPSYPLQ